MIKATELRLYNYISCKIGNDAGIYQVAGIDGWERKYEKEDRIVGTGKNAINMGKDYTDYRMIRITGGARDNAIYPEYKLRPIKITEEWLKKLGWKYFNGKRFGTLTMDFGGKLDVDWFNYRLQVKSHYEGEGFYRPLIHIKYVHQLQNLYFDLTGEELTIGIPVIHS